MVKMVLGSSDKQGSTMSSVAQARVAAYNQAISALTNFNGTGELTGAAYDSGKNYGMSTIIPLIKGALMYAESLGEAVPKLPSKYRAEVGGEDLDSAVLESEISGLESSLAGLRGVYRAMEKNDDVSPSSLQSISARMDDLTSQKNEKMEKLRKLNLFAGSSNDVFGGEAGIKSIDGLLGNIVTGINQVQTEFANFGGTFPSHSNDMKWAKNIEGEWTKKAEIDKNYQKVLKKLDDGKKLDEKDIKAIQAYQSRYPARDLPENVQKELKSIRNLKLGKKPLKAKIAKAEGIDLSVFWDELFGYTESLDSELKMERKTNYWLGSIYSRHTGSVTNDNSGILKAKFSNGNFNGVAIDAKIASIDLEVEDWKLNLNPKLKIFGYEVGVNANVGFNPHTGWLPMPEINLSLGVGETDKWFNEAGLKVSSDFVNGILGGYTKSSVSVVNEDKSVSTRTHELGAQTLNGLQVLAIGGIALAALTAPVSAPAAVLWQVLVGTAV